LRIGLEELLEVRLDDLGVLRLSQNLQEIVVPCRRVQALEFET